MYSENELVEQLKKVAHFQRLPEVDIRQIVTAGQVRHFPKDTCIFREGELSAGLYVIFLGKIHLCKLSPVGNEYILGVIEPVIMFNEVAALDGQSNPVTAVAVQDVVVWSVSYARFQALLVRYPIVGLGLLRILATRNRAMLAHYEDLTCRSILARAARFLLELSDYGKQPINRREHPNRILAARVSTGPEQFSRSIKNLQDEGVIVCNRSWITIVDADQLACLANVTMDIV